jgi:hemolysin activation/secretion protein
MGVVEWGDFRNRTLAQTWAIAAGLVPIGMLGSGGMEGAIAAPATLPVFKTAAPLKGDWQIGLGAGGLVVPRNTQAKPSISSPCQLSTAATSGDSITLRVDLTGVDLVDSQNITIELVPNQIDNASAQIERRMHLELEPDLKQLKNPETLAAIRQLTGSKSNLDIPQQPDLGSILNRLLLSSGFITSEIKDRPSVSRTGNHVSLYFKVQLGRLLKIDPLHSRSGRDQLTPLPIRWQRYICRRIVPGVDLPLNANRLEDQLRLLREDPAIASIEGTLKKSDNGGCRSELDPPASEKATDNLIQRQSCLDVRVTMAKPYITNIGIDNYSPPSVGSVRGAVDLQFLNVGTVGSELILGYANSFTGGNEAVSVNYRTPLSHRNNTLQARFVRTRNTITETKDNLDRFGIRGSSELYELTYRHPLLRTPTKELGLSLGLTMQDGKSFISDIPFQFFQGADKDGGSRTSVIRFAQDYVARSPRSAVALRSQFNIGTDPFNLFDVTQNRDPVPDGFFLSWLGQAQWLHRFSRHQLLITQLELQLTPDALLPSQQFVIGGGQSVRGYRQNARYGDNGFRFSVENRITLWTIDEDRRYRDWKGCLPEETKPKQTPTSKAGDMIPYRTRLFPKAPIVPEINCEAPFRDITAYVAPFFDLGKVWNNNNPNKPLDNGFLYSAGIGLGLETETSSKERRPSYSMRLDFALPFVTKATRTSDLQDLGIYFTFRYRF